MKSKFIELEDLDYKYAGNEIADIISHESNAVIVLLGKNVLSAPRPATRYTRNWIAFEVGVSVGCNKPVWVFENSRMPIPFPIPYITDYYKYNLNDKSHVHNICNILENRILGKQNDIKNPIEFHCKACNAIYNYWSYPEALNCPVCKAGSKFESETGQLYSLSRKRKTKLPTGYLNHNDKTYPLGIFLYVKRRKMEVLGDVGSGHHSDPTYLQLKAGKTIQIKLKPSPLKLSAHLADYDADLPSFTYLPKTKNNEFKLNFKHNIYCHNLHVFATYPNNLEVIFNTYVDVLLKNGTEEQNYPPNEELKIHSTSAIRENKNNHSSYVIDSNRDTVWSGYGKGSWIQIDLRKKCIIHYLEITWHIDKNRLLHFDVCFSNNGKDFSNCIHFVSTGPHYEEVFLIPNTVAHLQKARYVKLIFDHNTQNKFFSIAEIKAYGYK